MPHNYRAPPQHTLNQMYIKHPSLNTQPSERFAFPLPPKQTTSVRRTSTPDHRLKHEEPEFSMYPSSSSHRRVSTPSPAVSSAHDSRPHYLKPSDSFTTRQVDNRFPGPLRVPATPRFLTSSPPSPFDSPPSTSNSGFGNSRSFRSFSPPPLPSWRDAAPPDRLPPIRRFQTPFQEDLPRLSSARWHDDPFAMRPSPRFLGSSSPTSSSPETYQENSLPKNSIPLPNRSYSGMESRRDTTRLDSDPHSYKPRDFHVEADGYANKDASRSQRRYSPVQDAERYYASGSKGSQPDSQPGRSLAPILCEHYSPHDAYEHVEELPGADSSRSKTKFGVRRGSRFFCTYVSPVTGERCDIWDKGWTVYATLTRHAEAEHAPEELALLTSGELSYDEAQIITSREKKERIEDNLAQTGSCPDCGTIFSSKRRDSLSRHRQTSACEKAQKRGRPPTKFPKKPKGLNFQMLGIDDTF